MSIFLMSCPSTEMDPDSSSTILVKAMQRVDLPAPVLPTTPTLWPGSTLKLKSFKARGVLGLYRKLMFLNSIPPCVGQALGVASFPLMIS